MKCAEETLGRQRGVNRERWIRDPTWDLIDKRKKEKRLRDQAASLRTRREAGQRYRELDKQVKRSCRRDKRDWLEERGKEAEVAASKNDLKTLYHIVRELGNSRNVSNVPIKDRNGNVLMREEEQEARWIEHFQSVLNQPSPCTTFTPDQYAEEVHTLDVNEEAITPHEVQQAVTSLKNNKAPGIDEVSAELLKHGGNSVILWLTNILNQIWRNRKVPRDWRKGIIVKVPKKGSLSDCNNWRGITLLSVPGKVFCKVLLNRLKNAVDGAIREEQAGFRPGRSCSEQIFILRNIIEQSVEFQTPLYINYVDFKKAFDSIHRPSLWKIVASYGIPDQFIAIFKDLYEGSSCCIQNSNGISAPFDILSGVKQGCILSPFLFTIVIDFVLRRSMENETYGIPWRNKRLCDLDFADDIALLSENKDTLQEMTNALDQNAQRVGLHISSNKTKSMSISTRTNASLTLGGGQLEDVAQFTYLGSRLDNDGDASSDVNVRIGKAAGVFRRLHPVWNRNLVSITTKIKLYMSIVVPTAIYACETWKSTARITHLLNVFHQRCLRKLMKISWRDHITNESVLRRAKLRALSDIVAERRLRLAGHILRLPDSRHANAAMTWTPNNGRRRRGRPCITWRRTFKKDLDKMNIAWMDAKTEASDRNGWRSLAAQYSGRSRRT